MTHERDESGYVFRLAHVALNSVGCADGGDELETEECNATTHILMDSSIDLKNEKWQKCTYRRDIPHSRCSVLQLDTPHYTSPSSNPFM